MVFSRLPRLLGLCSKAFEGISVDFFKEQTYFLPVTIHLVDSTYCDQSIVVGDKNEVHGIGYQAVVLHRTVVWQNRSPVKSGRSVFWAVNLLKRPNIPRFSSVFQCLTM